MNKDMILNKKIAAVLVAVLALAVFITALVYFGPANIEKAEAEKSYGFEVNANGQTYGTPHYEEEEGLFEPDLVLVEATNGKDGYLNVSEMDRLTVGNTTNQKDEVAWVIDLGERQAVALKEAVEEYYGVDVLSVEKAKVLTAVLSSVDGPKETAKALTEDIAEPLVKAIKARKVPEDKVIALSANSEALDSGASAKGTNSIEKRKIEEIEVGKIKSEEIVVDQLAFGEIHKIAQAKVAISIPVYEIDGTTVVGEYLIDMM